MTKKDGRMSDYKRLTIKDSRKLSLLCDNCKAPKDSYTNECDGDCYAEMYARLEELEDKIESGRLVELPKPFIEQQKEEPYAWQVFHAKVDIFAAAGKDIFPKEDKEAAEARLKELQERRKDD